MFFYLFHTLGHNGWSCLKLQLALSGVAQQLPALLFYQPSKPKPIYISTNSLSLYVIRGVQFCHRSLLLQNYFLSGTHSIQCCNQSAGQHRQYALPLHWVRLQLLACNRTIVTAFFWAQVMHAGKPGQVVLFTGSSTTMSAVSNSKIGGHWFFGEAVASVVQLVCAECSESQTLVLRHSDSSQEKRRMLQTDLRLVL